MSLHTICQDAIRLHRSIQGPVSDLPAIPLFSLRKTCREMDRRAHTHTHTAWMKTRKI